MLARREQILHCCRIAMFKIQSNFDNVNVLSILASIIFEKIIDISIRGAKYFIMVVQRFVKVVLSFIIVYYIWFPLLFVPFYLLILCRTMISVIFKLFFRGKIKLMEPTDAIQAFDSYANVNTITFFVYINGECDLEELQARVEKLIRRHSSYSSQQPFWKLMHVPRQKYGFMCWKDKSSTFDVERHVRYFPGFDQRKQIYRESDLFEAVSELSCKEWPGHKGYSTFPKWEILLVPQLKLKKNNSIYSVITFRISHEYGDGISIMQMFRKHIFDKPVPQLLFDPVNPPIPKVPLHIKLFMYFQAFLFGPFCIMKFLSFKQSANLVCRGSLTGPKFFGHNRTEIPLEIIRKIRKKFGVSTTAIFHAAFCGALRTMKERKGQRIPSTAIGGMAYGLFPYPNDNLQNHHTPLADQCSLNIKDPIDRLRNLENSLRNLVQPYSLLTTSLVYKLLGMMPAYGIKTSMKTVNILFVISNVPGFVGDVRFNGHPVELIFGSPPSCRGIKYVLGVGCYEGKFHVGFFIDKTTVVQSKLDLDEFINAFECEIQLLTNKVGSCE